MDRKKRLPYLIARIDYDGRPWADTGGMRRFDHKTLGDDGWFLRGRIRKRWYIDVSLANYHPIIVARSKLNDIRALEDLRWRTQLHVEKVLLPLYRRAVARLRAADDPRVIRGNNTYRVKFGRNSSDDELDPFEEEIKTPPRAGIVDKIGAIPTPDHEDFLSGEAWLFQQRGLHSGFFRTGRAEAALGKALDLYLAKHHPATRKMHSSMRSSVVFIINGRYYPIKKNTVNWPQSTDIVINLDKEKACEKSRAQVLPGRRNAGGRGGAESLPRPHRGAGVAHRRSQ